MTNITSTLLLLSFTQLLFGVVLSQQEDTISTNAPLGSVLPSAAEQYGRVRDRRVSKRKRRQRQRVLPDTDNERYRRTFTSIVKAADVVESSKAEQQLATAHKSDPDLTLPVGNEIVAESTAEEDQKFAAEVVAAHQVDLVETPSIRTNYDKDQKGERLKGESQQEKNNKKHKHKHEHMKGEYSCFRTVAGTMDAMYDIVANYPKLATVVNIGRTFLGFVIKVLVLSSDGNKNGIRRRMSSGHNLQEKGKIFLTFGLHARELAPPELGIRWAEHLVKSYGVDADITQVLDYNEIHLLLHANPDGRHIAEKNPSLGNHNGWRKNAHDYPPDESNGGNGCADDSVYGIPNADGNGTLIYGVDLNRNFPYQWGGEGSSSDPCDDNYKGPSPYHPEPEVAAIIDHAKALFPRKQQRQDDAESIMVEPYSEDIVGVYVDVHASGKIVGQPWYYKNITAPNIRELMTLNHKFCSFNGHKPVVSGYDSFWYEAAGATDDYMYGSLGVAAFTFEVGHDQAENCNYFEREIVPHNFHALLYGAKVSRAPFRIPKGPDVTRLALSRSLEDPENAMRVRVSASDAHRTLIKDKRGVEIPGKYPVISAGLQNVSAVRIFVNGHPYDSIDHLPYTTIQTATSNLTTEEVVVDVGTSNLMKGRHTICVQVVDSDSYAGAVNCKFFNVDSSHSFVEQCVDSDRYFSLLKDKGSWAVRAKTCLDTIDEAESICGRRVKYLGDTVVEDLCPLRCKSECKNKRM